MLRRRTLLAIFGASVVALGTTSGTEHAYAQTESSCSLLITLKSFEVSKNSSTATARLTCHLPAGEGYVAVPMPFNVEGDARPFFEAGATPEPFLAGSTDYVAPPAQSCCLFDRRQERLTFLSATSTSPLAIRPWREVRRLASASQKPASPRHRRFRASLRRAFWKSQ